MRKERAGVDVSLCEGCHGLGLRLLTTVVMLTVYVSVSPICCGAIFLLGRFSVFSSATSLPVYDHVYRNETKLVFQPNYKHCL